MTFTVPRTFFLSVGGLFDHAEPAIGGEVWANMLHEVYASLVTAHGWSSTARTNTRATSTICACSSTTCFSNHATLHVLGFSLSAVFGEGVDAEGALEQLSRRAIRGSRRTQTDMSVPSGCCGMRSRVGVNPANHFDFSAPASC